MEKLRESDKLVISVREAMTLLGLSRNSIYQACHRGELPILRCGRRILISKPALLRKLELAKGEDLQPKN
jgi:excisionase family DNA binding protein